MNDGSQVVLAEMIPNSGNVIFPQSLKIKIDEALKTMIEVERRMEIIGDKDKFKKLIDAHNILAKYQ